MSSSGLCHLGSYPPGALWSKYQGRVNRFRQPHGKGVLTMGKNEPHDCYFGEWKLGLYDGLGKLELNKNGCYEGFWKAGLRHGKGK